MGELAVNKNAMIGWENLIESRNLYSTFFNQSAKKASKIRIKALVLSNSGVNRACKLMGHCQQ